MKIKYDKLFAVMCLLAVVVLFVSTGSIRDLASSSDPGARLLPYISEGILALCSVFVLIGKSEGGAQLDKSTLVKLVIVLGCMVLYALGLYWLGFPLSTPVMVLVFVYLLRGDNHVSPVAATVLALGLTIGLYLLFTRGFSILLPKGRLL